MNWTIWEMIIAATSGLAAGFINTVAGGGSLLTLPVLMFLGLPGVEANATNRVAILCQNTVGIATFYHGKALPPPPHLKMILPAAIGAILGAQFALVIPETWFRIILLGVMMLVLISLFLPQPTGASSQISTRSLLGYLVYFGIGIYGGFIQAGVGFLIIAASVHFLRTDLVISNGLKVCMVWTFTLIALTAFIVAGKVIWQVGIVMAVFQMAGAYAGGRAVILKGNKFVKGAVVTAILVCGLKILWDFGAS